MISLVPEMLKSKIAGVVCVRLKKKKKIGKEFRLKN